MACLQMLASSFNVPFRRDVMERICRQELRDRPATLGQIAGMTAVMGFQPSLLNLPAAQVPRAQTPCLAIVRDQPAIIYRIEKEKRSGCLAGVWSCALLLRNGLMTRRVFSYWRWFQGRDAQQRKLGFRWFLPQLRKYRRSLVEVLVASSYFSFLIG